MEANDIRRERLARAGVNPDDVVTFEDITRQVYALSERLGVLAQETNTAVGMEHADIRYYFGDEARITVEAHGRRWGLYYHRANGPVPLDNAPFEVRVWFLANCETFVAYVVDQCAKVFADRRAALAKGTAALSSVPSLISPHAIPGLYAAAESSIDRIGGAVVDVERAQAHAIVVAYLAPNSTRCWTQVLDLSPTGPYWRRYPTELGSVAETVRASLLRLGIEVEVVTDGHPRMQARRV